MQAEANKNTAVCSALIRKMAVSGLMVALKHRKPVGRLILINEDILLAAMTRFVDVSVVSEDPQASP